MMRKVVIIPILLLVVFSIVSCSPLEYISGDKELRYLANEEAIDLKFTYNDIKVGDMDEDAYVQEKVKEKNKKEAGSGDEWKKKWYGQRDSKLEPAFENQLNEYLEEKNLYASRDEDNVAYQIIIEVTKLEPGYYAGPVNDPGYISAVIRFVNKEEPNNTLTKVKIEESSASGADGLYTVAQRLKYSYRSAAVHLGRYIREQSW
jgi:hypothetical protein